MPPPDLPADPQERAAAKAALLRDATHAQNFAQPFVRDGVRITPTFVEVVDGRLVVRCTAHVGNRALDLDLPFVYVNPPVLVPDPAGDIPGGFRFDAAEAFRQIVADTVKRFR